MTQQKEVISVWGGWQAVNQIIIRLQNVFNLRASHYLG